MPNYPYTFQLPPLNLQDIPSNGAVGEFLGISAGGVLDWLPVATGGGDMLKSENLSGLADYAIARTNIGLGTASTPTFANLTLTSPSLSSSAPVTISQTWGTTGTYTAAKVNVTETATANSASNFLDLQLAGNSLIAFKKSGQIHLTGTEYTIGTQASHIVFGRSVSVLASLGTAYGTDDGGFKVAAAGFFGISFGAGATNNADVKLYRDGAGTFGVGQLALRNGGNPQTFNVYGTSSVNNTVYSRLAIACDTSGNATLTTQSTGVAGTVSINGVPVGLGKGNVSSNVAVGTGALNTNATGTDNVAVGFEALGLGTSTSESVAVGWRAAKGSSTRQVSIGYGANQLGATDSVSVGWASMFSLTGGSLNVAVGRSSGYFIAGGATQLTSCTKSLFLGCDTKALGQSQENQIVIGYDATGIGSNSVVLGNDSITKTALKGNVGIGTTSPTSKLHVEDASPTLTIKNSSASGFGALSFVNTVSSSGNGIWQNGSTQTGFGGASSLNIQASNGPLAFHTASVTNALSIAQNGVATFAISIAVNSAVRTSFINNIGDSLSMFNFVNDSTGTSTYAVGGSAPLMRFGGTTTSFPAIKRSATTLQIRLANDSDFAPIQGKLTTETAFTATTVTPTGFITLYDSTGAAYKVPCVPA